MADLLSFDEALARSAEIDDLRHLLLGNGFSIACRSDCFSYGRLLDEADLTSLSVDGPGLFESEGTTDFEEIVNALRVAARMAAFYESVDRELAARLAADADLVKAALADTLARNHPGNVGDIELAEYERARQFLANFGHIFTVSYDLLLYWALMAETELKFKADDGFRQDHDEPDAEWVRWDSYKPFKQNIYYLHGGLHLFEEGPVLKKLTFSRTGVALIDQIRAALDLEAYPLVITEGTSPEKFARIRHNDYLAKGLRSLATCKGSLFIHGHSLAANDAHVFRAVGGEGSYKALFVGLYGDPDSDDNTAIVKRAAEIAADRPQGKSLALHFYDSESASVWG
ncbi:MAG TPA: DUF4917 family protein [Solirubrobacterales bacterium]|jgi:hypothetical protein|nr:DUF4917 family protein [Solirubrobacterales bacterium]